MSISIEQFQESIKTSLESSTREIVTTVVQDNIRQIKNYIEQEAVGAINKIVSEKIKEYEIYIYLIIAYSILTLLFLLYITIISTYFLKRTR
jgi:hypothetical protein